MELQGYKVCFESHQSIWELGEMLYYVFGVMLRLVYSEYLQQHSYETWVSKITKVQSWNRTICTAYHLQKNRATGKIWLRLSNVLFFIVVRSMVMFCRIVLLCIDLLHFVWSLPTDRDCLWHCLYSSNGWCVKWTIVSHMWYSIACYDNATKFCIEHNTASCRVMYIILYWSVLHYLIKGNYNKI